ncbi:MAG: lysine--tRNA ligase [Candidatus Hodarchaeaceae archaeon]|nr:lysine--tRNA ligase [Candidatus Hodarchaeaceae archaeon]
MHWIDKVARGLMKRGKRHIIASGISISGHIHIGHCNDVFIADGIRRAVEELGGEAQAIWYADDYDPMRRIPWPLNEGDLAEEYKQYLGMPYLNIPSPDPKYKNFVDYFSNPFIESLDDFGIKVKIYSGAEIYKSGRMASLIRKALEQASEIRAILNRYRDKPLPENWLPFDVICENCGRIATTRAISWHGDYVKYRCEGCDYVAGCGHEGEADYTRGDGKLTWRVEWPARWKLLKVTCEPFGKDHAVVGGSYDTGKLIAKKVFGCDAPYPVPYEWVSLKGRRMSSSRGVVFTLPQWLSIAEPELLRYFIFRSKPMKAKEFDPGLPLLDFYDEYDRTEQVYFKKVRVTLHKRKQLGRIYELSQVKRAPRKQPQRVPFRFAAALGQITEGGDKRAADILIKRKFFIKPTALDRKLAVQRLACARSWVSQHAPERLRFTLLETLPGEVKQVLTQKQKQGLKRLAADLSSRDFTPVGLHNHIYAVSEGVGLGAAELFKAIYLVLLGRDSGPRAGSLISALDKKFVVSRFEEAAL